MREILKEYCTGCGLCKSTCSMEFLTDSKGFKIPNIETEEQEKFCKSVCMAAGKPSDQFSVDNVWGNSKAVCLGWSSDEDIRLRASSGGVITSLCCYLIDMKLIDGIIQTVRDDNIPYETKTVISRNSEQVKLCMGSRYSTSAPLEDILKLLEDKEIYAFVGKPCDVAILRTYLSQHQEYQGRIRYLFSFFCAGQPSEKAQLKLLKQLGCDNARECKSLQYRGNGWPGFATAIKYDGTNKTMTYNDSWGKILGRDVRKCCRVCLDGIGELADIACGDAWYLTNDGKPDFSEGLGRNVVFARTEFGNTLLKEALGQGYIVLKDYENYTDELKKIQKYQFDRRVSMQTMIAAMKLAQKNVPSYNKNVLRRLSKNASFVQKAKRFLGTFKRIKQGKI